MDPKRQGEIALMFFKYRLRKEEVHLTPDFKRQISNSAKAIGIATEEANEFVETVVRKLVEEAVAN